MPPELPGQHALYCCDLSKLVWHRQGVLVAAEPCLNSSGVISATADGIPLGMPEQICEGVIEDYLDAPEVMPDSVARTEASGLRVRHTKTHSPAS